MGGGGGATGPKIAACPECFRGGVRRRRRRRRDRGGRSRRSSKACGKSISVRSVSGLILLSFKLPLSGFPSMGTGPKHVLQCGPNPLNPLLRKLER